MDPAQTVNESSYNVKALIDPDSKLLQSLICFKCKNIASEAQQCEGCQQIACKDCLSDTSLANSQIYCEKCKNFTHFVNVPKFIQKYLNTLQFNCVNKSKGCEQIITYQELKTHQCKILCECKQAYIKEKHNCVELLVKELKKQRERADREAGIEEDSKKFKECLELKGEDLQIFKKTHIIVARTPIKCKKDHQLVLTKKKFQRITCNFCKTVFPKRQYFWSCHKCLFDLCLDCEKPKRCAWDFIQDYRTFMDNVRTQNYYLVSSAGSKCFKCKQELKLTLRGFKDDKKSKCVECQSIKKGYFWYCESCNGNFICLSCSPFSLFLNLESDQVQV